MKVGVSDRHPALVAHHVLGGEGEGGARLQGDIFLLKAPDANLRALGVQNGGHRAAHGVPDGFEHVQPLQMLGVAAVGKIEPGRVHAGADESADHVLTVHRGAQGADDLGLPHNYLLRVLSFISIRTPLCYRKKTRMDRGEFHKNPAGEEKKVCCPSKRDSTF